MKLTSKILVPTVCAFCLAITSAIAQTQINSVEDIPQSGEEFAAAYYDAGTGPYTFPLESSCSFWG